MRAMSEVLVFAAGAAAPMLAEVKGALEEMDGRGIMDGVAAAAGAPKRDGGRKPDGLAVDIEGLELAEMVEARRKAVEPEVADAGRVPLVAPVFKAEILDVGRDDKGATVGAAVLVGARRTGRDGGKAVGRDAKVAPTGGRWTPTMVVLER
ncbi:hypothetical protein OF83DRAFT_513158 [Amylostereum chailletii]|nr:hypothetical protein OF83DRAFT_513158 [Amylostereum chailletii]